jgi:tRNA-modifying protein YgfZ
VIVVTPDLTTGYTRLGPGGGGAAVVTPGCALLWVEGPDAASFLQGLVTSDVATLPAGGSAPALLLDAKGRIQVGLRCVRDGDTAFTLVTDAGAGDSLAAILARYHVSEDLDVLGPETSDLITVGGCDRPPAHTADVVLPGLVPGTWDLVVADARVAIAALGLPEAPAEALTARRIEAGVPLVGVDTTPTTLVQEAALEDVAVSFEKGCYLGQETVARVAYRGHVNRRLRGLLLASPAVVGAAVGGDRAQVGVVTSAAISPARGPVALAMVRTSVADGTEVSVDGVAEPARVVLLPFA